MARLLLIVASFMFKRKAAGQSPTQDACQCQREDCYSRFREDLHQSIQQVPLLI
ncbi:MAG: hypothetical protein V7K38_08055 [Nostoc sp.]